MSLTYETAKNLRGAGFSVHEFDGEPGDRHPCHCGEYEREDCVPTLSELIEACGEGRILVEKSYDSSKSGLDIEWYWVAQRGMFKEVSSTPEEAVANLWLALNKKDA